ncbi:MAG: hypothetical protein LBS42_00340 [Tannerella sp.]|jgi:hypothetical protein|nr:hypothetical protein [Tannerella sp.]
MKHIVIIKYSVKISVLTILSVIFLFASCQAQTDKIDREALVKRNSPLLTQFDTLASLSVGNGRFAVTVDATGLQTFPERYAAGVPLGTQSHWGWHSFLNTKECRFEETLESYDFGHNRPGLYAVQPRPSRDPAEMTKIMQRMDAANYFRVNPHRLHLGITGLELLQADGSHATPENISGIDQQLDMWNGQINSSFTLDGNPVKVSAVCHPSVDRFAATVASPLLSKKRAGVKFRYPYPTGQHSDDACDWDRPDSHRTQIVGQGDRFAVLERNIDTTTYFVKIAWEGQAALKEKSPHYFVLETSSDELSFTVDYAPENTFPETETFGETARQSQEHWRQFWQKGGAVDFSLCTDGRAKELERRVVLSQYLTAIQSAAPEPPQETGLTYNSWFGKFHLEMHWWHHVHFALWNRTEMLKPSLEWYKTVEPVAREIAVRQHFEGIRWMKMTDPSGLEAPSSVGSFLIWQQPHYIYMAELIYRQEPTRETLEKYLHLVMESAAFMASFATLDEAGNRYVLKGCIPAQETLRPDETVNPPFELSYWHFALSVAQQWRERAGMERDPKWDDVINRLSPLAEGDGLYLAAESAPQTYREQRFTSDHPIVLGAVGILPQSSLLKPDVMRRTFDWVWDNWNWDHSWGWDYPTAAMCAARLGEPEKAVNALLMDKQTNTYLPNGHNYQNDRLRIYLPGNGGLLTAVAMMCAGWDGNTVPTPGFPKNGTWNVRWEGLEVMP